MESAVQRRERPKRIADSQSGYGAEEIADVLDQLAFAYHFYGHTGEAYRQNLADNGITRSVKIKELEFDGQGKLLEGCMLILEGGAEEGGQAVYALACAVKRDHSFYAGHLVVLLMRKGRIENPSFCFANCFSGSLHHSRLPENSCLK